MSPLSLTNSTILTSDRHCKTRPIQRKTGLLEVVQYWTQGALSQLPPKSIHVPNPLFNVPASHRCQTSPIMELPLLSRPLAMPGFSSTPSKLFSIRFIKGVTPSVRELCHPTQQGQKVKLTSVQNFVTLSLQSNGTSTTAIVPCP